jgi:hypothetical protein
MSGIQTNTRWQLVVVRRPLAPGSYRVVVTAPGFANATAEVTVPQDGSGVQQVMPDGWLLMTRSLRAFALPLVPPAAIGSAGRKQLPAVSRQTGYGLLQVLGQTRSNWAFAGLCTGTS